MRHNPQHLHALYATFDLVTQHTIFGHEVLIAYQQFLIDSPSDIRQQVLPIHRLPLSLCRPS
jgi:hypothetical protein